MANLTKVKAEGGSKATGRPKNFTDDEDVWLACAYAETSLDPVLGSGPKKQIFWSKVFSIFEDLRKDDGGVIQVGFERDVASIRNRWQRRIKPESMEYAAILNGFPKKSGESDELYSYRLGEEYKNKNKAPFRFVKAWEHLKVLPEFGYEVQAAEMPEVHQDDGEKEIEFGNEAQAAGVPEVHQDDGEKEIAVATARVTTPRPMGAKRALAQSQSAQKKSKSTAEVVKGLESKMEDVASAMRERTVLEYYHRMLEFYSRAGNQEKVEETIAKMETFVDEKFLLLTNSRQR